MVTAAIVVTVRVAFCILTDVNCIMCVQWACHCLQLVFSFSKYVDWAAHFGGAIQGAISGVMMLTVELDNFYTKVSMT
jgi:membrane associated rhomboid family serine protease